MKMLRLREILEIEKLEMTNNQRWEEVQSGLYVRQDLTPVPGK
jgi:hypothetical protein